MRNQVSSLHQALFLAMVTLGLQSPAAMASGYTFKLLHTFCVQTGCPDGQAPFGLIAEKTGVLYGTALEGGKSNQGAVYALAPKGSKYTFTAIYDFCKQDNCTDGRGPIDNLVEDTHGNLYGTTSLGGENNTGTIFTLMPKGRNWKHKVLHSFCVQYCADGDRPETGLSYQGQASGMPWDGKSPLFGTTLEGGASGHGAIFEFVHNGSEWNYSVVHNIGTGAQPNPVLVDQHGNLFVTSFSEGANDGGNFYMLAKDTWEETTIHAFCTLGQCADGDHPVGTLALDKDGNVFGVTFEGGVADHGVAFEHPASGGFTVIYNFCSIGGCADGAQPNNLSAGSTKRLFGAAGAGGMNDNGVVFALTLKNGLWSESVIHEFCADGNCTDGAEPDSPLTADSAGNLFGTAEAGGSINCFGSGCGTAFELKP